MLWRLDLCVLDCWVWYRGWCWCWYWAWWTGIPNVAKSTTEPRVECLFLRSHHKFLHKSWSNFIFRISSKHQLQNLNQTSASRLNFNFIISPKYQQKNTDQASASKFCLNQGGTTCGSLAARLRENGGRMRKWRGNGESDEMERKWRENEEMERCTLYILSFLAARAALYLIPNTRPITSRNLCITTRIFA